MINQFPCLKYFLFGEAHGVSSWKIQEAEKEKTLTGASAAVATAGVLRGGCGERNDGGGGGAFCGCVWSKREMI